MRLLLLSISTLLLGGCASGFTAFRGSQDSTIDELRMEIADLKHALHGTDVEVKLLEERVEASESSSKRATHSDESVDLKKKIATLEKTIDKMNAEIRTLTSHAQQTTASLTSYREQILNIDYKLDEISKLRSTLSQLSQTSRLQTSSSYTVKAGDSLEKIARKHQVSVEALKRENNLSSDKIMVGEQLTIPSS